MLFQFVALAIGGCVAFFIAKPRGGFLFGLLGFVVGVAAGTGFMIGWGLLMHYNFGARPGPALMPAIQTFVMWAPGGAILGLVVAHRQRSAAQEAK